MHDSPSYLMLPVLARWKKLTHFSCLVLAEHATNRSKQAEKMMAKCIFLLENIIMFFKILALIFLSIFRSTSTPKKF
jgi:hypothetical protein